MDGTRSNDPLRILEVLVGLVVAVMAVLAVATLAGTVLGSGAGMRRDVEATI